MSSPAPPLIRLTAVEKRFDSDVVLEGVDLALHEGDRLMIIGANGSGKSTLLRIVLGVTRVDRGRVWQDPRLRKEPVGYVPQRGGLYRDLSLLDNLVLRRRLYGRPDADPREIQYIEEFGLLPHLNKRFAALSGGLQRLSTVAAALYVEPTWLVLDEPFAGVDASRRECVLRHLSALAGVLRLFLIAGPEPESLDFAHGLLQVDHGRVR
jgi:iron(III) transport system ATP-binding protein